MLDMKVELDTSGLTEPWHGQQSHDSFVERPRRTCTDRRRARFRALTMTPSNNSDEEDEYFEDNGLLYQLMETLGNKHETSSLDIKTTFSTDLSMRKTEHSDHSKQDVKKRVLSPKSSRKIDPMFLGDFDTLHGRLGRMFMKDIFGHKPTRKSVKQRHYNDIQLLELGFAEDSSTEELYEEKKASDRNPTDQKETIQADDYWMNLNSSFAKFRSEFASLENTRNSKSLTLPQRRKSKSLTRRKLAGVSRRKAINSDTSLPKFDFNENVENTTLTSMLTEINRSLTVENTKKKAKHSKNKTVGSVFLFTSTPTEIPSRAQRKYRIPRPDNKRFIDLHIRSVHKKFNRPLPEINLQKVKRLGVGDISSGDIIFIVDYHEPNSGTIIHDSRIRNSRISNSRISKPKQGNNLISYPEDFVLDIPKYPSKRNLVRHIPELKATDAEKHIEPSDTVRARHVMICTNTSPLKSVIEAAHVTSRRARVSTLKPPVSPTELELQKRLSFVQMGMNQRGVLPLRYKALVYRLSGYPSCASEIASVASKFIGTSRIIPRVIDVDKVLTDHEDGFLKRSPRSLFRAPVREVFDNCGRFVNVYSNEFMILSVQRALYQMFKTKTTSFKNIKNILDMDPINPWPSVSHSYMHQQKDWTLLGLLDFQFQ